MATEPAEMGLEAGPAARVAGEEVMAKRVAEAMREGQTAAMEAGMAVVGVVAVPAVEPVAEAMAV